MLFKDLNEGDWFTVDGKNYIRLANSMSEAVNLDTGVLRAFRNETEVIRMVKHYILESQPRQTMPPMQEAKAFQKLIENGHSIEDLARQLCINKIMILKRLKLLTLPKDIQRLIEEGKINIVNANMLCYLSDPKKEVENATEMHVTEFRGYIQKNYHKEGSQYVPNRGLH